MRGSNGTGFEMKQKETFEEQYDFFPFGVQYHRAPTPLPEEWPGDLQEIKKAGYTHIQFRPQWRWHERIRGKPTWDDLDRLFDLAEKNKLRVVLKPMLETAPDWVFDALKGTRIGFHGIPLTPFAGSAYYVGGWWPCFDNPDVVTSASSFVRRMIERYHKHPALWFYDAWNEPRCRPLGQCHCIHSMLSYRNWLKNRYGTIESLNRILGKAWTSYDSLQPPVSCSDYTELFLWRQWAAYSVAEQVRFVVTAIRSVDPKAFIMVHGGCSSVVQDPACDTSDDLLNAKMTDRYGISFPVPLRPATPIEHAQPDYQSDWVRRVDPRYWCHEFYPNHANWCRPPEPKTLRRIIWMAIAGGPSGLTFWQYRSERFGTESNGFGFREIDGSPTERSRVADRIALILKKHGSRLVGTVRVPSPVALLYSRESDLISRIQKMEPGLFETTREKGNVEYAYKRAVKAAHVLYLGNGETVDWVVPGDDLDGVLLLHVTMTEMLDGNSADWLRTYVRKGGTLVVEFPFACRDEKTWVSAQRPNHNLEDLLGCKEAGRVVIGGEDRATVDFPTMKGVGVRGWHITLSSTQGKSFALWGDGSIAGVRNRFGKGEVFALGANVALSFGDTWKDPSFDLYAWILKEAGLKPHPKANRQLWVRKRAGKDREIWFVFNVSERPGKILLPAVPSAVWEESGCVLHGRTLELDPDGVFVAELALQQRAV